MPIHPQYAAERLKPIRVAETGKKLRGPVSRHDVFRDGGAQRSHPAGEPRWYASAMKRKIGRAGPLHLTIFAIPSPAIKWAKGQPDPCAISHRFGKSEVGAKCRFPPCF